MRNMISKIAQVATAPKKAPQRSLNLLLATFAAVYNLLVDWLSEKPLHTYSGVPEYDEVLARSRTRTDISDHLPTLFLETLEVRPSLIVELGVRGGESTFVLERVAALCGSKLVSVDLEDCSRASQYCNWSFVKSDDVAFADIFGDWCQARGINPSIDILFIDTSHELEYTIKEIDHWGPFLAPRSKVFFHDTNMRRLYLRKDGSIGVGWQNHRGVVAALERYLRCKLDERRDFSMVCGGWIVKHYANCSGLTILDRWIENPARVKHSNPTDMTPLLASLNCR